MKPIPLLVLALVFPLSLSAQELALPASVPVYSDYGPRNYSGYDWHWGLDYDGPMWSSIYSVEGGTISAISAFANKAKTQWIWHLDIQSDPNRYWYYMHI